MSENKKTYLEERVYEHMHLSPEQCAVPLYFADGTPVIRKVKKIKTKDGKEGEEWIRDKEGRCLAAPFQIFQSDKDDGIKMYPYTIDGKLISYLRDKQPKYSDGNVEDVYFITRRNPEWLKEHPSQPKYNFPGGETKKGTYPFFPPTLFDKYQKGTDIETLVLTEGYMKAMDASVRGMDVVGLGSITLYAESKTKQLYGDIVKLINKCHPKNIVILYDGDCTDIKKEDLIDTQAGKTVDLAKRPMIFKSVLLKLRELLLEFEYEKGKPCELYFAYVARQDVPNPPKGLDDLIDDERFSNKVEDIAADLNHPGRPGEYFNKLNLRTQLKKVSPLFGLASPENFYQMHEDDIDPVPDELQDETKRPRHLFKYGGSVYQYSVEEKKLVQQLDCNLDDYIAVGGEIVLVTEEPIANANGTEWKFFSKPDKVINARYGEKTAQKIYKYRYYEDYTIKPCHENFEKEVINPQGYRFYNMYSPCPYKAEPGEWPTIAKLLHQITKVYPEEQYHYYDMLLDYFTIMWFKPFQYLPIIMLVSKERGTGKSSFLNLGKYIFGHNAVNGGNDLLISKFNSLMAAKIWVGVDESCLGDNKEVGESLKYMSTARTMHIEMKGKDKKEMPAFVKFILCSNEVKKGVFVSKDEIRFWVMRLTPWEDDNYDVEFDDKLEGEVPAFLQFLSERWYNKTMFVKEKEHRMYFDPKRLVNDDLHVLMTGTQSNFESSLINYLHDMFIDTKHKILFFDVDYIKKNVPDASKKDENYIRNLLEDMKGVVKVKESSRYSMPYRFHKDEKNKEAMESDYLEGEIIWPTGKWRKQCRPFRFDAKYFVEADEYETLIYCKKEGDSEDDDKPAKEDKPAPKVNLTPEQVAQYNAANKDGLWPELGTADQTDSPADAGDGDKPF